MARANYEILINVYYTKLEHRVGSRYIRSVTIIVSALIDSIGDAQEDIDIVMALIVLHPHVNNPLDLQSDL